MAEVMHVTSADFDEQVLQQPGRVLVDFWAEWCGPCRMMSPVLDSIAEEAHPNVRIVKVNVDEEPALAQRYHITAIPSLKVFENGEVIEEQLGVAPRSHILDMLGIEE